MTEEQADKILRKENDKYLLKLAYDSFIQSNKLEDCFENTIEFLDKLGLLKVKKLERRRIRNKGVVKMVTLLKYLFFLMLGFIVGVVLSMRDDD